MDVLRHWIELGHVHCLCGRRATGTTPGGVPECDEFDCNAAMEFKCAHPKLAGAVEALERYGSHDGRCEYNLKDYGEGLGACTCGYQRALDLLRGR